MNPSRPFRLTFSGVVREQVQALLQRAGVSGILGRVYPALRWVEDRLRADPVGWGDPIRHLRHASMTTYHRIYDEMSIFYGVHDREPIVWLLRVTPVLGHPLRQPDGG